MAIFSSVRSSNSHPDLLVITTTHFFRSHRSSILDFHFLSHNSYIKGNHITSHHCKISCRSAAEGSTHRGGAASQAWGGAPYREESNLFQNKNITQRGEKVSHLPCPGSSYLATIFLCLALERRREVGPVAFVCPTILPGPGKGRTRNLENVTRRLVPISSAQCLTHTMLWGGDGWGWMTCGGGSRPARNPRLP